MDMLNLQMNLQQPATCREPAKSGCRMSLFLNDKRRPTCNLHKTAGRLQIGQVFPFKIKRFWQPAAPVPSGVRVHAGTPPVRLIEKLKRRRRAPSIWRRGP